MQSWLTSNPHIFRPPLFANLLLFSVRRFNSGMQQPCINCMAERAVDKAGGVKGLPPEAVGA